MKNLKAAETAFITLLCRYGDQRKPLLFNTRAIDHVYQCCQHWYLRSDNSSNIVVNYNSRSFLRDVIERFEMSVVRVWNEKQDGTP